MPATLEEALKEAYASAPDDAVILHTLEFRHASFASPIRVVHDNTNHLLTLEASAPEDPGADVVFVAYNFDFQPPGVSTQGAGEILITIDNVTTLIEQALKDASESATKCEVTYRQYLLSDPTTLQNDPPLTMTMLSAKPNDLQVTARCSTGDVANKKFPGEEYTATRFPGLVAG